MRRVGGAGWWGPAAVAWLAAAVLLPASPAAGQWISPGQLSSAHAELDGDLHCTACHALRERGVKADLCLECHAPLARRVEADRGYHASPEREDCGECHREHFGRDVMPLRFDTVGFDHRAEVGWPLRGSHDEAGCRDCHRPALTQDSALAGFDAHDGYRARTYLGLATSCDVCHAPDDPHGDQFADRACGDCHDEVDWARPVLFAHDRTRFPLTGRHTAVECSDCHATVDSVVRYAPLASARCDDCHEDPHGSAMSGACAECHGTAGWQQVGEAGLATGFDHAATRFPLVGAHGGLECDACHRAGGRTTAALRIRIQPATRSRAYPLPTGTACSACHVDEHQGRLAASPGGGACEGCHSSDAWIPTGYGVDRHNRLAVFVLAGAHAAVPCGACHRDDAGTLTLKLGSAACVSCHREDDPHEGRFGDRRCDACHGTATFRMETFDHADLGTAACADCHAEDDPHDGQFAGRGCDACHVTDAFAIPDFPHEQTGFVLDGAHARAPCAACHPTREAPGRDGVVQWAGVPRDCDACHGGGG